MKQPLITLPNHQPYQPDGSSRGVTLKCKCGWQVTRPVGSSLVDDWHAHLDDVIRRSGREP